jgi:hypothetical protein
VLRCAGRILPAARPHDPWKSFDGTLPTKRFSSVSTPWDRTALSPEVGSMWSCDTSPRGAGKTWEVRCEPPGLSPAKGFTCTPRSLPSIATGRAPGQLDREQSIRKSATCQEPILSSPLKRSRIAHTLIYQCTSGSRARPVTGIRIQSSESVPDCTHRRLLTFVNTRMQKCVNGRRRSGSFLSFSIELP